MSEISQADRDCVAMIIRKTIPVCLAFPLLGAALGWIIYGDSNVASRLSWEIGVSVSIICCSLLACVRHKYRGTNALMAYGIVMSAGVVAIYYFFGVVGYFYFFLFSSDSEIFRWVGATSGLALTLLWMGVSYKNVSETIRAMNFVGKAFVENRGSVVYRIQNGTLLFDEIINRNKHRSTQQIYAHAMYGVAPLGFALYRTVSGWLKDDDTFVPEIMNNSQNCLRDVVKRTVPLTMFVNVVSMTIAYGLYSIAFRISLLPFWITAGMSIFVALAPGVVVLIDKGRSRLFSLGVVNMFMLTAFYFFCGIVPFFFYFIFAPMPASMRAGGLTLGVGMTSYWMALTARDVKRALTSSRFVHDAFEDAGSLLLYRLKNVALLEAVLVSRSPSGRLHMYLVLMVAPLALVMGRILAPVFGPHGPVLISALILFPVSQWIAGIGVRQYMVMVHLPRTLERTHGKPVIVMNDES